METAPLKNFATWARKELIREVTARIAAVLAPGSSERVEQAKAVAALEKAVTAAGGADKGRAAVADKVAYTWFNRIVALRFMDANGYTGIGVVSPQAGVEVGQPEILAEAKRGVIDTEIVCDAIVKTVAALLDGTRASGDPQGEAYALLLEAYCNYWHKAMPFMFEREGDFTELLVPANLLADDSVFNRSVKVLTEEVCQDVEVIGWLYQFYISERKDEVFAGFKKNKKAGADEIPAATQLFTPHWIVRYLVENSLGRLWMLNRPNSRLVDQMDYYIAPVDEEADFLRITKPEELKVMDPACGSGHMLTYAFDLLHAIYEEEGYGPAEIPGLILTHNLYGTEIDPRSGALAAFALTMKARRMQRSFFNRQVDPNICVIEPISFSPNELDFLVTKNGDKHAEEAFWNQFAQAHIIGALIQPDPDLTIRLARHLATLDDGGDMLRAETLQWADRLSTQAQYLAGEYAVAIANPPYMSTRNMSSELAEYLRTNYPLSKHDLFAAFIDRCRALARDRGHVAMVTMHSWMFTGSYVGLRTSILSDSAIAGLAHLGSGAFGSISGEVVQTVAFQLVKGVTPSHPGVFVRLADLPGETTKMAALRRAAQDPFAELRWSTSAAAFRDIPGTPIAYWLTDDQLAAYQSGVLLSDVARATKGIDTGENARFLRRWSEVAASRSSMRQPPTASKWVPYNKGGGARRWYGLREYLINWESQGAEVKAAQSNSTKRSRVSNEELFFTEGFTWSTVSPGAFGARYTPADSVFDSGGSTLFANHGLMALGGMLNTQLASGLLAFLAPTINTQPGDVQRLPVPATLPDIGTEVRECIQIARDDWDSREESMDFVTNPLLRHEGTLAERVRGFLRYLSDQQGRMVELETKIERDVRAAFGLTADEVAPRSPTLWKQNNASVVLDLVSFAVGCMFGRYSLDEPGLILSDQGATLQDYLRKVPSPTFLPDADNVIPIVGGDWFEDDIVERFRQFLRAAFGEQHFEENLRFVTESLGVKNLRDYFVKSFYKDHVQRYKKRPIYWLFSSPKGSFNALIYMHRYTPSTASTVLNEYLWEFQAKLKASLEHAERTNNAKEADRLRKILLELDEYEHDVLYPLASQNIAIDLDDGVKTNYPKLGTALKKIPGLEGE